MGVSPHPVTMSSKITIERYSHGVRLSGYSREVFAKLAIFLESLKLKEPEKLPQHMGGGMTMVLKKRYYGLFESQREAYIHRHHLPELLGFLKERGISSDKIDYQEIDPPKAAPVELPIYDYFVPKEYQTPIIESLKDDQYSKRVDLATGLGKAQPLDAKLRSPDGWVRMGDIRVGDKVTTWDGSLTEVTGVYPQGVLAVYTLTTESGRKTQACMEHLWVTRGNVGDPTLQQTFGIAWDIERGISRWIPIYHADGELTWELITSVDYTRHTESQCISVDHPDRLYVTDDDIVTHNTFSSLKACADMGERIVVMIPPKYFGLWIKALRETYIDIENRYVTVSGSDELKGLMSKAVEGDFPWDVILISSATYRAYIDNFEKWGQEVIRQGYEVPPPVFHDLIQAGVQINDEIQDDPGLVFRIDIFTNIRKQIYLSATPFTGSDFVTRMIDVMVPHHMGVPLPETPAYINVVGLLYSEPNIQKTDYLTPFKGTYNHARYETRMLKKKKRLDRYFKMVRRIVNGVYAKDREKGQKLLILCSTVDFIKALTKFLNTSFPDLRVGMHVSGSDYKKLLSNDITVSTIKSSGTGVDIPDLREVIMLQATDSKKDNIQVLGRLRRMKNFPETTPRFTYLICRNINKHVVYHRNKTQYFDGRVKNQKIMQL